ncbi:hypothetical protein [Acetobacter sp. DsW_063]|uniref:hypothetical protein n=1 Tax=Acetobacter sp. DsW_063 TaxID=1514894 RepID=UPI0013023216|nr:hypothetical protein [Acetobacter sp. DsW_063]
MRYAEQHGSGARQSIAEAKDRNLLLRAGLDTGSLRERRAYLDRRAGDPSR